MAVPPPSIAVTRSVCEPVTSNAGGSTPWIRVSFQPDGSPGPNLYCAVIVKKVDEQTRAKTSINELLRE